LILKCQNLTEHPSLNFDDEYKMTSW